VRVCHPENVFERAPRGPEWVSWLWVGLGSGVIFSLVPMARALEARVEATFGEAAFLYAVFAALIVAAGIAIRQLRHIGRVPFAQALTLFFLVMCYAAYIWQMRENPVEALHFVEYGVLSVLAFRALSHRIPDVSVYLGAALIGGAVGIVDEAIQWATPQRVWDLRDMGFNFIGASAIQVGIAVGLRPARISLHLGAAGLRRVCGIAAVCVVLLAVSLLNTPTRIASYSRVVPALAALGERPDVMIEYGHRYDDPEIGVFRSRFAPEDLSRLDAERGESGGRVIASFSGDAATFIAQYTTIRDPFLHEMRVHLFRRDRYLETARTRKEGSDKWRSLLTVAHRENLILEKYFPVTLRNSRATLTEQERQWLAVHSHSGEEYESRVSEGLVTRVREVHVPVAAGGVLLALWAVARLGGRRLDRRGP
jgi:VanZ family protein